MELYGLVSIIDGYAFGDAKSFLETPAVGAVAGRVFNIGGGR